MKKISLHFIFTILISSTLIKSCNSENSVKTTNKEVANDDEVTHSIEIDIVDHDFEFMPPSPIQIASILKKANMSYEDGLTNKISNARINSSSLWNWNKILINLSQTPLINNSTCRLPPPCARKLDENDELSSYIIVETSVLQQDAPRLLAVVQEELLPRVIKLTSLTYNNWTASNN